MKRKVDYIIVGQGLAGSSVAMHLLERNKTIMVFDDPHPNSASKIAAGLFNPITGKNMVKTWLADETFTYLHQYYASIESIIGSKFFNPTGVYHPFSSIKEQNEWMARSSAETIKKYIASIAITPQIKGIRDPYGGVFIAGGGYINTNIYLEGVQHYLVSKNAYTQSRFDDTNIQYNNHLTYQEYEVTQKIIFCLGNQPLTSDWFNGAPIISLKGETLRIKGKEIENQVINKGVYMVPEENGVYNVGATYQLGDMSPTTSQAGKEELTEKLKLIVDFDFEIVEQNWGMRPTTHDRRPIIGGHPIQDKLVIFNGLGTKGVSLSPYFGRELVRWLEKEGGINKEVNITRYKLLN